MEYTCPTCGDRIGGKEHILLSDNKAARRLVQITSLQAQIYISFLYCHHYNAIFHVHVKLLMHNSKCIHIDMYFKNSIATCMVSMCHTLAGKVDTIRQM